MTPQAKAFYYKQSDELIIGCFGSSKVLDMLTADTNLGGQCCGTLKDPAGYNFTKFDADIVLTPAQQAIYDESMENSHHGGSCCCKCWKWYVMSGLAKKMIVDYDFTPEDVSELWDISSSCERNLKI